MIKLGLIGYPLGHSLSPMIHKAALAICGLVGDYELFPIPPGDMPGLEQILERVRRGEILGLNVTIPHKSAVIPLLDELTPTAKAIGAVNTIFMRSGKLTGENTDAVAFLGDMKVHLRQLEGSNKALVLGAGGAARAVAFALAADGWRVTLAARRSEQAQALIAKLSVHAHFLTYVNFTSDDLQALSPAPDVIVNTTPVGMFPESDHSPWPVSLPFPPQAAVYDLVYNPRDTRLVVDAKAAGLQAVSGWGMLVEQAALAFELWLERSLPRETLFVALEEL